jgi:3-oxoacid CoA-transferase subunit A
MFWISGDKHSDFTTVENFCAETKSSTVGDCMILLGDVGLNYYRDLRDVALKQHIAQLPITFLSIHGNHEARIETLPMYQPQQRYGATVFCDPQYPNQLFLQDGNIYTFGSLKALVIGGAFSMDKFRRLQNRWPWFEDEQPSAEIRARTEASLDAVGWQVDIVLSHTCPRSKVPMDAIPEYFLKHVAIDFSTEDWLETIMQRLSFKRWYVGHYHLDDVRDNFHYYYDDIRPLGE